MKNPAYIAIPVALIVAAGAWYLIDTRADSTLSETPLAEQNMAAVAATVNGTEINNADVATVEARIALAQGVAIDTLDAATRTQIREAALNELIAQALLAEAAADIEVAPETVDAKLAEVRGQFETDEAFAAALAAEGFDEASLREQIKQNLQVEAYLDETLDLASVTATDEEIEAFYNAQIAAAGEGATVPALEELREQITAFVEQQNQQALIAAHLAELQKNASVEIHQAE